LLCNFAPIGVNALLRQLVQLRCILAAVCDRIGNGYDFQFIGMLARIIAIGCASVSVAKNDSLDFSHVFSSRYIDNMKNAKIDSSASLGQGLRTNFKNS
jgi:hypothetical protein